MKDDRAERLTAPCIPTSRQARFSCDRRPFKMGVKRYILCGRTRPWGLPDPMADSYITAID